MIKNKIELEERLNRVQNLINVDLKEVKLLRVREVAESQGLRMNDFISNLGLQWVVMSKIWYNTGININKGTLLVIAAFLNVEVKELFEEGVKEYDN